MKGNKKNEGREGEKILSKTFHVLTLVKIVASNLIKPPHRANATHSIDQSTESLAEANSPNNT